MDSSFWHLCVVLLPILTTNKRRELCLRPDFSASLYHCLLPPTPPGILGHFGQQVALRGGDLKGTWEVGGSCPQGLCFVSYLWLLESEGGGLFGGAPLHAPVQAGGERQTTGPAWAFLQSLLSLHSHPQPGLQGPSLGIATPIISCELC